MDNSGQVGESHADISEQDIAPVTILPFSFNRFNSESKENLIKCTHLLFIKRREVEALIDPEFHT